MARSRVVNLQNFQQFTAINVLSDPGVIGGPVIVPNGVRVIVRWGLPNGRTGRNILGGMVASGFTPTTTIAENLRAGIVAGAGWSALAAFLTTTCSVLGVDIQDLRTANLPLVSSTGGPTAGTSASPALTSETALAITIRTARTGPGGRGRMYVPGFASNAVAAGDVVAPAVMTAMNGFISNIATTMTANGITWALVLPARAAYTGVTGTQHPARAAQMLPQAGVVVRDNHWDSQRRRGLK